MRKADRLKGMFYDAGSFNQPLSWDTSGVGLG